MVSPAGSKSPRVIEDIWDMTVIASDARIADMQTTYPPRSAVVAWIFFDWAAQPYFTLITTFVFAPYFATHVAADPASGQSLWGFATAAAGLLIALSSPVLGDGPRQSIAAAAGVLKSSGVVDASVDLDQVLAQLFEPRFTQKYASAQ